MVTNKTIGAIMLMTVLVSLITLLYLTKGNHISGMATQQQGDANINILSQITIVLLNDEINWGVGKINCTNITLDTGLSGPGNNLNNCWTGETENDDFIIKSMSNVNITVEMQSNTNAFDLFGSGAEFQFKTFNVNGTPCNGNLVDVWTDYDKTWQNLCSSGQIAYNDKIGVGVRMVVFANSTSGQKEAIITFRGS